MTSVFQQRQTLGWTSGYQQLTQQNDLEHVARVIAVDRDALLLANGEEHFRARVSGSYRYHHAGSHEAPCVGDWVVIERGQHDGLALITECLPRRTHLQRKAAGDAIEVQMIAANADVVVVVQSCHLDFNLHRLERYLVMIAEGGCEPFILLTKTDLVSAGDVAAVVDTIRQAGIRCPLHTISNLSGDGLNDFVAQLLPGTTYCFVGSSGVGKSTLTNHLLGRSLQSTQDVSGTGEGRHTTVRRELFVLDNGALIIDNPGMREFGLLGAEAGLEQRFSEVLEVAGECRFRDCTHNNEPGCAVRAALQQAGTEEQFDHYRKLQNETDFNDLNYAQRRQKDRDFGRFLKDVKKNMRKK